MSNDYRYALSLTAFPTYALPIYALFAGNRIDVIDGLLLTVILGAIFSMFQAYEYANAFFTIKDTVYGSVFYLSTGFHGFHVLVGTIFLAFCLARHYIG